MLLILSRVLFFPLVITKVKRKCQLTKEHTIKNNGKGASKRVRRKPAWSLHA